MIELFLFTILVTIGFVFGRANERRHLKNLQDQEQLYGKLPARQDRNLTRPVATAALVTGSVVIASDYFKVLSASLKSLFGGSLKSYESLLDRARREAAIRLKEQALGLGADEIINLRYETSAISSQSVEIFAYGTAITYIADRPKWQ